MTFDLWHTLLYLTPAAEERYMRRQSEIAVRVLEASPRRHGLDPRDGPDAARRAFEGERALAIRASEGGRTIALDEQWSRAARRLGRVPRPTAYRAELRRELERTEFRIAPGAFATLRELRDLGYRVGIISNTVGEPGALLRPLLSRMGFDEWVERCVFSDEERWSKPSGAIFRYALRRLGSAPSHAIHVGDGWSDIEGARRARLRAGVWYTGARNYGASYRRLFAARGAREIRAGFVVERLDEVPRLAERLLPIARRRPRVRPVRRAT